MTETERSNVPDPDREVLLQQYRLYVEMADKVSERRQSANNYFLTLNSGILALVSVVERSGVTQNLWVLALVGGVLSMLWYATVSSYKQLNSAKFKVVHQLEQRLPAAPYDMEWELVERGQNRSKYWPTSHVESWVPLIFALFHLFVFLFRFPVASLLTLRTAVFGG